MTPLRVEMSGLKWLAYLGIAFFGFCTIASRRDGFEGWFLFLFFVALGIFLVLIIGPLEMNDQFIRHTSPLLGRHQMNWDEVEKIEIAYAPSPSRPSTTPRGDEVNIIRIAPGDAGDMVLHGGQKRLAIPGMNLWSGSEKERMVEFFNAQILERGIPIERTRRAAWQIFKNTKVRRRL